MRLSVSYVTRTLEMSGSYWLLQTLEDREHGAAQKPCEGTVVLRQTLALQRRGLRRHNTPSADARQSNKNIPRNSTFRTPPSVHGMKPLGKKHGNTSNQRTHGHGAQRLESTTQTHEAKPHFFSASLGSGGTGSERSAVRGPVRRGVVPSRGRESPRSARRCRCLPRRCR